MRYVKMMAFLMIPLVLLSLAGCGSGSGGTAAASNPFTTAGDGGSSTGAGGETISQGSVLSYKLTLSSDKTSVGINSEVLFSATLTTSTSAQAPSQPVQSQTILFSVVAGPATFVDSSVNTDSTGTAVSRLKTDLSTTSSSNVIVKASTIKDGVAVDAYATLQVLRQNSFVINFLTGADTSDPNGNLVTLSHTYVAPPVQTGYNTFKQLVPFQVLDNNGIPKPNVDVTIEVFNYGRNPDTIIELIPPYPGVPVVFPSETTKVTIKTDDLGMGIFTCNISQLIPGVGGSNTESVIYKATATILPENISLQSYGGFIATVSQTGSI